MSNCGSKGACAFSCRKGGSNAVHCRIQAEKGGKWDFCKYQFMCQRTNRFEMGREANSCNLAAEKLAADAKPVKKPAAKKSKKTTVKTEENG